LRASAKRTRVDGTPLLVAARQAGPHESAVKPAHSKTPISQYIAYQLVRKDTGATECYGFENIQVSS
jgi:hypothetical protein